MLNLVDGVTSSPSISSPVAVSESPAYQRQFSSVYDSLRAGEIDVVGLREALYEHQPPESGTIAGYDVYAVDVTWHNRPEAPTLSDRGQRKRGRNAPVEQGHKYSWLARIVSASPAWVAPQDIERVATSETDSQIGVEQVKRLDAQSKRPKVVVGDSLYGNKVFLAVILLVATIQILVRLRSNRVLYEKPPPRPKGKQGRPRKYGARFKLSAPSRPPDRQKRVSLKGQTVLLEAWHDLRMYGLAEVVGLALRIQFLKPDGTPRYKRPLWLFWTGPETVPLVDLCQMYLWRFTIEHAFRFMKQNLGLIANQSTNLHSLHNWLWVVALAYTQLLLIRHTVQDQRPAWHPRFVNGQPRPLTVGQVQRAALTFFLQFDIQTSSPKRSGKGKGRQKGFRPPPRTRYPVVRKSRRRAKKT